MLAKSLGERWFLMFLIVPQLAADFKYFLDQPKKPSQGKGSKL